MTIYTLTHNVAYEGSTFLGAFESFEHAIDYINNLEGYLMDEFIVEPEGIEVVDDGWALSRVHNGTGMWYIDGPSDVSFTIYSIALGV